MGRFNTVTIICIVAALVGQGAATTSKVATTTNKVLTTSAKATTTGKPTPVTTTGKTTTTITGNPSDQSTTTTAADQGATTTMVEQGTTTTTADQGVSSTTTMADQGTTTTAADQSGTTTTTADQGTPSTTAKQGTTTTAKQGTASTTSKATTSKTAKATMTTTTAALGVQAYSGGLTLQATGATKAHIETALKNVFADKFVVPKSAVNIIATESSSTRRLGGAALRQLASTWAITYTITVPVNQKAAMDTQVSALLADTDTFLDTLGAELVEAGAPQSASSTLQVSGVTLYLVTTTTSVMVTTTTSMNATTTQFLEPVPLTGGSSLRETAFLYVILLSTTMMTLSGM